MLFAILKKSIDNFHNNFRECKTCNIKRSSKLYYEKKIKYQVTKNCILEKIEMCYLQSVN